MVKISLADIADLISNGEKLSLPLNLADISCHMQAVVRSVQLIIQAYSQVYGHERLDGFIKAILTSRATMLQFSTKIEFSAPESECGS